MLNFNNKVFTMKIAIVVPFFMGAFSASAQTAAPKTLLEIIKE